MRSFASRNYFQIFFFFISILGGPTGKCQPHKIYSLLTLIANDKDDTNKVRHLIALSLLFSRAGNTDTAILLGNEALSNAEKLKDFSGSAEASNTLGIIYFRKQKFQASLNCFLKAIKANDLQDNASKSRSALIYDNMGLVYEAEGNYSEAHDYYIKAMNIIKEMGNKQLQAYTFNSIADFYSLQGNKPKALEYYLNSITVNKELGNKGELANGYNNIGVLYKSEEDYPHALIYYMKALNSAKEAGDKKIQASAESNIAAVYYEKGEYSNALSFDIQTLKLAGEIKSYQLQEITSSNIGLLYWKKGDYSRALQYYGAAFAFADSATDKSTEGVIADNMGIICESQGDFPRALEYEFNALNISTATGDKEAVAINKRTIGDIYIKQKNYKEAEKFILQALYLADSVQLLQTIEGSSLDLSNLFSQTGEQEKSYKAYLQYVAAKDRLLVKNMNIATEHHRSKADYTTQLLIQRINNERNTALETMAGKRKRIFISAVLLLSLAAGAIAIIQIRINRISGGKHGNGGQNDYFVLYMPSTVESGKFCWREQLEDVTLVAFGSPDDMAKVAAINLLKKIFSAADTTEPKDILVKARELVNQAASNKNEGINADRISLLVLNHTLSEVSWENSDMAVWIKGKNSLVELPPDPQNKALPAERNNLHSYHAGKEDLLYAFSTGWLEQLNSTGVNLFRQYLKVFFTLGMDEQRKKLQELIEKRLEAASHSQDILLFGIRI